MNRNQCPLFSCHKICSIKTASPFGAKINTKQTVLDPDSRYHAKSPSYHTPKTSSLGRRGREGEENRYKLIHRGSESNNLAWRPSHPIHVTDNQSWKNKITQITHDLSIMVEASWSTPPPGSTLQTGVMATYLSPWRRRTHWGTCMETEQGRQPSVPRCTHLPTRTEVGKLG